MIKYGQVAMLAKIAVTGVASVFFLGCAEGMQGAVEKKCPAVVTESPTATDLGANHRVVTRFAGNPIPSGTNSCSIITCLSNLERFYVQLATRAYENGPSRSEKWDEDVRNLIGIYAKQATSEHEYNLTGDYLKQSLSNVGGSSLNQALKLSDDILTKGCADPFVEYMRAVLLSKQGRRVEEVALIREVKRKMEEGKYAPVYLFLTTRQLKKSLATLNQKNELASLDADMMKYLGVSAGDPLFKSNGFQRCYMRLLPASYTNAPFALCLQEIQSSEGADPWIKVVVSGRVHVDKAWESRGSGWASEVAEEGWKGFASELKLARQDLRTAQGLHPEFPEAACDMISVAMGGGDEDTPRQWFDRAVAAQFDYLPAYNKYIGAIYPRWGGSHEEMFSFGVECLNTKRMDTGVPYVFAITLNMILKELRDIKPFFQAPGVFENVEKCFKDVLPKCKGDMSLWQSRMVMMAWAAGRDEEARQYYRGLKGRFRNEAVDWMNVDPAAIVGEIFMPEGAQKERYREADQLLESKEYDKAFASYKELKDSGFAKEEPAAALLRTRLATSSLGSRVSKGEWTPLVGADDLDGWMGRGGEWQYDSSGAMKAKPIGNEMMILCRLPMPRNFEIEGDLKAGCPTGVILGLMKTLEREEFASVLLDSKNNKVRMGTGFPDLYQVATTAFNIDPVMKDKNHFLISVQNGKIIVNINNKKLFTFDGTKIDWWNPDGGLIGLGGIPTGSTNDSAVYRNLRIRMLPDEKGEPLKVSIK